MRLKLERSREMLAGAAPATCHMLWPRQHYTEVWVLLSGRIDPLAIIWRVNTDLRARMGAIHVLSNSGREA